MLAKSLVLMLSTALGPGETEAHGVHVQVELSSSVYTWTVTNREAAPITRLHLEHQFLYNPTVPDGWSYEYGTFDFEAWADAPRHAIPTGGTASFRAQVGISGAVLGHVPMRLQTDEGELVLDAVWGPVKRPTSHTLLVVGLLLGIGVLEAWRNGRRG